MHLGLVALGAFVLGTLAGAAGLWLWARPHGVMAWRAFRMGLTRCVVCDGQGYFRDVTLTYLAEQAEREAMRDAR